MHGTAGRGRSRGWAYTEAASVPHPHPNFFDTVVLTPRKSSLLSRDTRRGSPIAIALISRRACGKRVRRITAWGAHSFRAPSPNGCDDPGRPPCRGTSCRLPFCAACRRPSPRCRPRRRSGRVGGRCSERRRRAPIRNCARVRRPERRTSTLRCTSSHTGITTRSTISRRTPFPHAGRSTCSCRASWTTTGGSRVAGGRK
jgi:hypothetical protein